MSLKFQFACGGLMVGFVAAFLLRADVVEMQNGDRYSGTVVSLSAGNLELKSPELGRLSLARSNVAGLTFGTNSVAPKVAALPPTVAAPTNPPAAVSLSDVVQTNAELSALLRLPDAQTNSIRQIREQMLGSSPEAVGKFNELLGGLMTGKLSVDDIRREARAAATQLRELKRELGPEASGSLDGYLSILEHFLGETPAAKTNAPVN